MTRLTGRGPFLGLATSPSCRPGTARVLIVPGHDPFKMARARHGPFCRYRRDIHSRWCMRYIGANFFTQFKNKHLMEQFKSLCKETNQRKFSEKWKKLDELTEKNKGVR